MMNASIRWDWVASLYDTYVTATFDLPFFLCEATATDGDVLELMCGTGRVSVPLVEAGVHLTCVDESAAMLARPREKLAAQGLSARRADGCAPTGFGRPVRPGHSPL